MAGNLCAVLQSINKIELVRQEIPKPGPTDVLIKMNSVGICGSDVHYWVKGAIGDYVVESPMVLGHEGSGTVVECGDQVTNLKPGDRIAIEPGYSCRFCEFCKAGRYNLCLEMKFCATPPVHGNLCNYFSHPADFCYKLPDHVSFEEGALLEPLSVAVHACRRAELKILDTVLILGSGTIGLVCLLTAKAFGASKVVVTDIDDSRLNMAKSLGADAVLNVSSLATPEEQKLAVHKLLQGQPNISIECSGAESSIKLACLATKSGGRVLLVGLGPSEVKVPILNAALREVDIRGIFRYANCYPTALGLVSSGKVNVKPLVTNRFSLGETLKAFETAKNPAKGVIKVMIKCD